ncbi:hypothetical protein V6N13_089391 [Hibiscus sabdariffa]|uniref:Uncharacterized protein n=1 Tax=Hibiscus sabdariffa TaxID=183260 RepID=A0ABR2NSP3_9ROSI
MELVEANERVASMAKEIMSLMRQLMDAHNAWMRVKTQVVETRREYTVAQVEAHGSKKRTSWKERPARLEVEKLLEEFNGYANKYKHNIMFIVQVAMGPLDLRSVNLCCSWSVVKGIKFDLNNPSSVF